MASTPFQANPRRQISDHVNNATTVTPKDTCVESRAALMIRAVPDSKYHEAECIVRRNLILLITVCFTVGCASCRGAMGTPFFSKFSPRDLVERNKTEAGLRCEPLGGGGAGGISSRAGALRGYGLSPF